MKVASGILFAAVLVMVSCGDKSIVVDDDDLTMIPYNPGDYVVDVPDHFPALVIPADNPLTREGVELGRHLFYDPILSSDGSTSCSTCHLPEGNFTDNLKLSKGVDGQVGRRNAMSLLNVGLYTNGLFWDGRAETLEEQALLPVEDPVELHESWPNVENKLKNHADYPSRFRRAFGIESKSEISRDLAVKAIAQFERTLISSGNSKYDRVIRGDDIFTDEELQGHNIFFDIEPDIRRHAECGHCHNAPLFTTNEYLNNGLDEALSLDDFDDPGLGEISGVRFENGTFRVPSLRNIFLSAPYMHDGRFASLDEVIDHYTSGGHRAPNLSPILRPLNLSEEDRMALIAFIKTLEDQDFVQNPNFQSPF